MDRLLTDAADQANDTTWSQLTPLNPFGEKLFEQKLAPAWAGIFAAAGAAWMGS